MAKVGTAVKRAADAYAGLNANLRTRVQQLIAASGGRVYLVSGYRSVERQKQLFAAAVKKYGSEKAARKWVAPPGKSNHNHGLAADLGGDYALIKSLAPKFGLHLPMSWEPWHVELIDNPGDPAGHTDPPDDHVSQEQDRFTQNVMALGEMLGVDVVAPERAPDDGSAGSAPQGSGNATLDRVMAAIKKVESGGNYKAIGPRTKYGQASGAYQWLDSTWGNYKGYRRAADAPPEVQEERARRDMQGLFDKYGGDPSKIAMHWHGGPNTAIWGPKTRSYAQKVTGLL